MNDPKITQRHEALSVSCSVEVNIRARAESIWKLLTDAEDFPRWNTTVVGIQGQIREGERLRVRVPGTDRTFTPKVRVSYLANVWSGLVDLRLYSKAFAPFN
jgi:uncharacterized protein YndB with AHSA1/START domain